MSDEEKLGPTLWHQSGVNRDGEPFVQLILDDKVIVSQTPEQARAHALAILESAEAAEQDAFLVDWVKKVLGLGENPAAHFLQDFREWRRVRTGKRSGQEVIPVQRVLEDDRCQCDVPNRGLPVTGELCAACGKKV